MLLVEKTHGVGVSVNERGEMVDNNGTHAVVCLGAIIRRGMDGGVELFDRGLTEVYNFAIAGSR